MKSKKLSRREFLVAASALTGSGILAACGPGAAVQPAAKPTEPPAKPTEKPAEAPAPTPVPQPTVQVFAELQPPAEPPPFEGAPKWVPPDLSGKKAELWGLQYDPHIERYNILAETFKKRTGATIDVKPVGWPIDEKVMAVMAAGTAPDVICWMGFVSEPVIRQKGIVPIDDSVYKPLGLDIDKWWFKGAIDAYTFEGNRYGVPVESEWDGYTVTGRLDLIAAKGADAAKLWPGSKGEEGLQFESYDDLFALAEMLQQKDDKGNVKIWGLNSSGWDMWSLLSIIYSLGTDWWDPQNKKFNLDSDAAVEGLRLLVEIPFKKGIEGVLGMSHIDSFVAGQVALARGNGTTAGEGWKLQIEGENVLAPPPQKGGKSLWIGCGGWGFELCSQAKNQDVAVEFLKFMSTYEAQFIFSQIYGASPPATRALVGSDIYKGDHPVKRGLRRQMKALENWRFWGFGWPFNGVQSAILEAISAMREGKLTAQEAAKQMQEGATKAYETYLSEL